MKIHTDGSTMLSKTRMQHTTDKSTVLSKTRMQHTTDMSTMLSETKMQHITDKSTVLTWHTDRRRIHWGEAHYTQEHRIDMEQRQI